MRWSRWTRRTGSAAVAVAVALGVTACGSSSSKSSSSSSTSTPASATTASSPSTSTPAATGAPIKIGTICSCTGPQASSLASAGVGIAAWASAVNRSGGLNGHPIKLFAMDDGGNPTTSLQDVKQLVESDKVVAIVSDYSDVDVTWAKYVAQKGIPVVGGLAIETPFISSPGFFADGASSPMQYVAFAEVMKGLGKSKFRVVYCAEAPICALSPQIAAAGAAAAGIPLNISSEKISSVAPNYTAPCLSAKGAGVEGLAIGANSAVVPRVIDACAQQGFHPTLITLSQAESPAWPHDPAFSGAVAIGTVADNDTSLPAIVAFQQGLNVYKPGFRTSAEYSINALGAWIDGKLFEAVAKQAKLTPSSTPADVLAGLYGLKGETLGGLTPPLTYTKGQPLLVSCWFEQRIAGGKYVAQNGNKPICASPSTVQNLGIALKKLLG